ncbi:hypothetical protein [Parapedobacter soli]|uniref:hypothetical protein n=1 Tax=Parapedobacter soli TaxID=416955 RepID=UPI0021C74751|nr:hypothetical protein [Parapedobacter soli]
MKRLLLLALLSLCACKTQRLRSISQQDSSLTQTATSIEHVEKATAQSTRQYWQQWVAESADIVILPAGPVSYHPVYGFEGEATAILLAHSTNKHTQVLADHTAAQRDAASSAQHHTSARHTHAQEHESRTDRQPVWGYSFRWLAIALVAGGLLLVLYRSLGRH